MVPIEGRIRIIKVKHNMLGGDRMAFKGGDIMGEIVKFEVDGSLIIGDGNLGLSKFGNSFLKVRKSMCLLVRSTSNGRDQRKHQIDK